MEVIPENVVGSLHPSPPNVDVEPSDTAVNQVMGNPELLSVIMQWLKDITLASRGIVLSDDQFTMPSLPKSWRAFFARLVSLNHAFYNATIDILWEYMDTLDPFFKIILPSDSEKELEFLSFNNRGVSSNDWMRFIVYSHRTRFLSLKCSRSTEITIPWLMYLTASKDQPHTSLFPRLRHLHLATRESLPLFVAFSVAPVVKVVNIALEDMKTCLALTMALSQSSSAPTHLQLTSGPNVNRPLLNNISQIQFLTSLRIKVGRDIANLEPHLLDKLTFLEALWIEQATDSSGSFSNPVLPFNLPSIQSEIARKSNLRFLESLTVQAYATTQYEVASYLSPNNLKSLTMEALLDASGGHLPLLPIALAIHAARNPTMTTLRASIPDLDGEQPEAHLVFALRSDPQYYDMEFLTTSISAMQHLTELQIQDILFFPIDTPCRLLHAALKIPTLTKLCLKPVPMTDLESDSLIYPPVKELEEVIRRLPNLVELSTLVSLADIPFLSRSSPQTVRLKHLNLQAPHEEFENGDEAYMLDVRHRATRYLDRLFPKVEVVKSLEPECDSCVAFWEPEVEQLLKYSQACRVRDELERSAEQGWGETMV